MEVAGPEGCDTLKASHFLDCHSSGALYCCMDCSEVGMSSRDGTKEPPPPPSLDLLQRERTRETEAQERQRVNLLWPAISETASSWLPGSARY